MNNKHEFSISFKIAQVTNKMIQSLSKVLNEFDIAPEQRAILNNIKNDPLVSQNKLGQNLGKNKATISRTLDALDKRGYIVRESLIDDKRVKIIKLTTLGEEVLEKTEPIITKFRNQVTSDFTEEEIDIMFALIEKMLNNIDKFNDEK